MDPRSIVILLTLFAAVACSEPLEFADWTIPVPEGTRVIEYRAVPLEERTERIELVEDLVLTSEGDDLARSFYRIRGTAVDSSSNVYVLDAGNHRVQVFNAEGAFVRTIGREGQGPGEFLRPQSITTAGDRLVVFDSGALRLNWWSSSGEFLTSVPATRTTLRILGLPDGSLAATHEIYADADGEARTERAFFRLSSDGEQIESYLTLPLPWQTTPSVPVAVPELAVGPSGLLYVTPGNEYQVFAFEASGATRWVLRTSWAAQPVPEDDIERYEAVRRERRLRSNPEVELVGIDWPEHVPAVSSIAVDGHGHVYVFPYKYLPIDIENPPSVPDRIPVDVYSAGGEHLFSGTFPSYGRLRGAWEAAHENQVFRSGSHPATREDQVVRYRLVEPF